MCRELCPARNICRRRQKELHNLCKRQQVLRKAVKIPTFLSSGFITFFDHVLNSLASRSGTQLHEREGNVPLSHDDLSILVKHVRSDKLEGLRVIDLSTRLVAASLAMTFVLSVTYIGIQKVSFAYLSGPWRS